VPAEARPLIQHLVGQRLLATDVDKETGERTIEPVHEALLRQWGLLQGWLAEDAGQLAVLAGIRRAARDWAANGKSPAWLAHVGARLRESERLNARPDLAASLEPTDREYLAACHAAERSAGRRKRQLAAAVALLVTTVIVLGAWYNRSRLGDLAYWFVEVRPYVLSAEAERRMKPGETFRECGHCPDMVAIPLNDFNMGSPATEPGHQSSEAAVHPVRIAKPLAVAKYETTFAEWGICVARGGCTMKSDERWGRGDRPVINVTWDDAQQYVAWLTRLTGKPYRLLSEAEWEYAARANSQGPYSFSDDAQLPAAAWYATNSGSHSNPVGHRLPNGFGLFDMYGNVAEWCADNWHERYGAGAPRDGSVWTGGDSSLRVVRGGAWYSLPGDLRSASRSNQAPNLPDNGIGFRVARTLMPPAQ
jgi:formylglycine-generating enzyme required for sulfatase activity